MYILNKDLTFCQNLSLYYFRLINIMIFYDFFSSKIAYALNFGARFLNAALVCCLTCWNRWQHCCHLQLTSNGWRRGPPLCGRVVTHTTCQRQWTASPIMLRRLHSILRLCLCTTLGFTQWPFFFIQNLLLVTVLLPFSMLGRFFSQDCKHWCHYWTLCE